MYRSGILRWLLPKCRKYINAGLEGKPQTKYKNISIFKNQIVKIIQIMIVEIVKFFNIQYIFISIFYNSL